MDLGQGSQRGIPRLSRLPMARGNSVPTHIHQDDPTKQQQTPRALTSHLRKPNYTKALTENGNTTLRTTFANHARIMSVADSPMRESPIDEESISLDTTPPNARPDCATTDDNDDENVDTVTGIFVKSEKRRPRPSLSERTMETLASIPSSPSPSRKRSSTINSNGSMGPPPRPASSSSSIGVDARQNTAIGRPSSPTKRPFRPPGRPTSPAKDKAYLNSVGPIYTPPRALMRDQTSRIGRPLRENRRSISTAITASQDAKPVHTRKPSNQAVKVKSMYDLRAAASRTLNSKPSLPTLVKNPATPKREIPVNRKASFHETSPQATLLKARQIGENVLASPYTNLPKVSNRPSQSVKLVKRTPTSNEARKREPSPDAASKTSASLRETIAKAKAAKKEELRRTSLAASSGIVQPLEDLSEPQAFITMGSQSLQKRVDTAVTSGTLNLSALGLKSMPSEVLTMYDFKEDSHIVWSEAVDLTKLLMADNELEEVTEGVFPDWTKDELLSDVEKSNQFGGLETLDLHGNKLRNLPQGVRRLERLSVLNLSNNNLDLAIFPIISQIPNLHELYIGKNGLNGMLPLQITNMESLQVLDLSDNQLDDIPENLSNLTNLQKLFLAGNRLRSFSFTKLSLPSLVELDLSRNGLSGSLNIQNAEPIMRLQLLDVSNNSLDEVSFDCPDLASLHTLAVQNNRLKTLRNLSQCRHLVTLTVSENQLAALPSDFCSLVKLKHADLSGNSIKHLEPELTLMENLTVFNVAGNPLRVKKYLTMTFDEIKSDLAQKTDLGVAINEDASIPNSTGTKHPETPEIGMVAPRIYSPKAGVLDISSQNLSNLDMSQVDISRPIHTIRLANNDFSKFPIELLRHPNVKWNLRSLDMSHNPGLHPVDYLNEEIELPLLQSLYVVSTGLTTLDTLTTYLKAPELKELNISCHRMTGHIPWVRAWYPSVTTLLASDNWFDSIDVEAVRGLEVLDVRNNEIESIPPKIGLLGHHSNKFEAGKLRSFECSGNRFRIPRLLVIEKGTEAVLRDLRRMVPVADVPEEWVGEA